MYGAAAIVFTASGLTVLIAMEFARSLVHRRRQGQSGLGGTQAIALGGSPSALILLIGGAVSGLIWLLKD